jgi:hypothetical protein
VWLSLTKKAERRSWGEKSTPVFFASPAAAVRPGRMVAASKSCDMVHASL